MEGALMDGKHLMVSGTRVGATPRQLSNLGLTLAICWQRGFRVLHDGDCVGVDIEARGEATQHGYYRIVHPSTAKTRAYDWHPAYGFVYGDEYRQPRNPLVRNVDMILESALLIAVPRTKEEELRSGTWAAVRRAKQHRRRIIFLWPDGEVDQWKP